MARPLLCLFSLLSISLLAVLAVGEKPDAEKSDNKGGDEEDFHRV